MISHSGAWVGYQANLLRFPDQHLAVACLCNLGNLTTPGPDTLAFKLAEVYLGSYMGPDTVTAWATALAAATVSTVPSEVLRGREGVWRNSELGEVRRTRMAGDRLVLGIATPASLVALGTNRFRSASGPLVEVLFGGDSAGRPTRLTLRDRSGSTTWLRVPEARLSPSQLAEYAGDYYSAELDVGFRLAPDSGKLVVSSAGRRRTALESTYRDAFSDGLMNIDFVRNQRGRVTGYLIQAFGRVRNLKVIRRD